jgi:hypothetical protein
MSPLIVEHIIYDVIKTINATTAFNIFLLVFDIFKQLIKFVD